MHAMRTSHQRPVAVIGVLLCFGILADCSGRTTNETEAKLAKLVKIFSKPGAFNQIDAIFGEEEPLLLSSQVTGGSGATSTCPVGEEGLECRRAEARRSVDCPRGDCYCYNCSKAGSELWASCCRESLKCCSHLAAACRTCDQPPLFSFCAKHFKRCLSQLNDKKTIT
ncbi:uncharacterized protein LOC106641464 [Copidosoma floridanum]|uniref:uncharacterized protein LOC106641464 n=1 Tax=Copidosoma floridanum TaxID=29053 RepID=UPI0006C97CFD|nr:uncharacterized protein LOC106641464 [Copidosoma floridanum]